MKNKMNKARILPILLIIATIFIYPDYTLAENTKNPNAVVVTIKPLYSLVAAVMGEGESPYLLVSDDISPHEFHLKPSQIKILGDADIIFYIDDNFENFLKRAIQNLPENIRKAKASNIANLDILTARRGGQWEEHEHEHEEHEHEHEEHKNENQQKDYHLFLDPDNAREIVKSIASELSALYPQNKDKYSKNADAFIKKITQLDKKLKADLESVADKKFIVFHDATQYFERHYGLHAVGSITFEPNESPSPSRIKALREKLQENNVACVFSEPYFSDKLVKTVLEGSKAKAAILDPEATSLNPDNDLYLKLLENLAKNIKSCLNQE